MARKDKDNDRDEERKKRVAECVDGWCKRAGLKLTWVSFLVRTSVCLKGVGQSEKNILVSWQEQVWPQLEDRWWALEWRSYYLEVLGAFAAAAEVDENLADLVKGNAPNLFVAAILARAAYCLEHAKRHLRAAELFVRAGDLIAEENRTSHRALHHYQAAVRLDPKLADQRHLEEKMERLQQVLDSTVRETDGAISSV